MGPDPVDNLLEAIEGVPPVDLDIILEDAYRNERVDGDPQTAAAFEHLYHAVRYYLDDKENR